MSGWLARHRRVRDHAAGLVVLIVALALRLAYVNQSAERIGLDLSQLTITDNHVFAQWAAIIADGDVLCREQPHAYHVWTRDVAPESKWLEWYGGVATYHQAPLYPYFVAAVYTLFDRRPETLTIVQAVLGALTCWLTWLLARRLISPLAGFVAGMLLAGMGSFYFQDDMLLRDGPISILTVLLALAAERAVRRGRALDWLLAGAATGLFTLAKETGPGLLVIGLAALLWFRRGTPAPTARAAALLVLGWLLVLSPAVWRNHEVGAPLFKLSTRGPEVFVVGNARGQDGVGWDPRPELLREILVESNFQLGRTITLTLATHRTDPFGYLGLLWNKTAAFFNGYEIPNNADYYLHRVHLPALRAGIVSLGVVAPLAILGLLLGLPRRRELSVLYLLFVSLALSVIALYVLGRFRTHVVPLMVIFAALTVDWFVRALRAKRHSAVALACLPLGVLLIWCAPGPAARAYNQDNAHTGMMMLLVRAGNHERALRFHEELRLRHGRPEEVAAATGPEWEIENTLEAKLGVLDRAFLRFRNALQWSDDRAEQHVELGRGYTTLMAVSKRDERRDLANLARDRFDRALKLDSAAAGAHYGIGLIHAQFGDWGPAYSAMHKELEQHPESAEAWRDAGTIRFSMMRDEPGALALFRTALALGLEDARMLAVMARIEIDPQYRDSPPVRVSGKLEAVYAPAQALPRARRALALLPDDPLVLEHSATVLYANGLHDEAVALLQQLADLVPWRRAEFLQRGELYLKARSLEEARRAALEQEAVGTQLAPTPDPSPPGESPDPD